MRTCGVIGLLSLLAMTACAADSEDYVDSEADGDASELDDAAQQLAGAADSPVDSASAETADVDADGIPDAVEEMMLRRYRPFYQWTANERFGPANAADEITNSQLETYDKDFHGTSAPLSGCGRTGDHHLDPPESLFACRTDTSMLVSPAKSFYALNLDNSRYHGVSIDEASKKATGFYGHVSPATIHGHDAYQIEYWQFFAFNNQDVSILMLDSFGDHEGDWTSVQLWYDRVDRRLAKVRYLIHGNEITFDIPSVTASCRNCTVEIKGSAYSTAALPNLLKNPTAYNDRAARFFIDQTGYRHVVVYIERGGHEYWPTPEGYAAHEIGPFDLKLNSHAGDGPGYLVPDTADHVFNLGEVGHALTRTGKLVLGYNGLWGSTNTRELNLVGPTRRSPPGPALHCSWGSESNVAGCDH